MRQIKKIFGIVFLVVGILVAITGTVALTMQFPGWLSHGIFWEQLRQILILLAWIAVGLALLFLGIGLLRKRIRQIRATFPEEAPDAEVRKYRSSRRLLLAEFGLKFLFGIIVWGLAVCAVALSLRIPLLWDPPYLIAYAALILLPPLVFAACWAFAHCNIRITVGPKGMHFYRRKVQYDFYPLEAQLHSRVTREGWKRWIFGARREFFVPGRGRHIKWVRCWCITTADFEKLSEDFNYFRQLQGLPVLNVKPEQPLEVPKDGQAEEVALPDPAQSAQPLIGQEEGSGQPHLEQEAPATGLETAQEASVPGPGEGQEVGVSADSQAGGNVEAVETGEA